MPTNLPIELVRQILVALGPCSLNPDDRQDATRRTLYCCCLASKALKAVAQPLLYQAVVLRRHTTVYKFSSALHANPELPLLVQTYKMPSSEMWIEQSGYDTISEYSLGRLCGALQPQLVDHDGRPPLLLAASTLSQPRPTRLRGHLRLEARHKGRLGAGRYT
ncbi:hypothetical protein BJY59DRAFT_498475 [Rhodotorula toruloides]